MPALIASNAKSGAPHGKPVGMTRPANDASILGFALSDVCWVLFSFSPTPLMQTHIYLSLIPEALIMSQLPPDKFGAYMATGSKREIEGPAVFFEVDPTADLSAFRVAEAQARCKPHQDGSPRRSIYMSVFNVLPRVPLNALQRAYLTTPAGLTLVLDPADWKPSGEDQFFLYQELGPVYPRVASRLEPRSFVQFVANPDNMVSLPRVAFIDLKLGVLSSGAEAEMTGNVPYQHLDHLRSCLRALQDNPGRMTKIVNRGLRPDILFSMIRSGIFVGDRDGLRYFPMPSEELLESEHNLWWHSAQALRGY